MKELFYKFLKFLPLILWASCTVNRPVINDSEWNLTFVNDLEIKKQYETLDFFVNVTDEDGENDIETIFLIDDDSGLYWELNNDNLSKKYINKELYLGSENIVMPNSSTIPRSKYKLIVRDLAGETTEDTFFITKRMISVQELDFPELKIDDIYFSLNNYAEGEIFIYNNNSLIYSGVISDEPKAFNEIFNIDISEVAPNSEIYVTVKNVDLKLKSGPYIFNE